MPKPQQESSSPHEVADGYVTVNHVRLHFVTAGEGPLVLLLHGFPEFWYSWRHQLPSLADAGFRPVALDLRGYNMSDRPKEVAEYRTRTLVEDVAGVIRSLSLGPALVVGHDWGGIIAWRLAALHPELVRRLVVINAPHPEAFREQLRSHPGQWLRSSYALFFQIPWLPERLIAAADFAALDKLLRHQPWKPGAFTQRDVQLYKAVFGGPQGLTGPINYYRAAMRYPADLYGEPTIDTTPTLVLWGEQDPFLGAEMLEELRQCAPLSEICRVPQASHWLQNEQPERVNDRLRAFLG